MANMKKMRVANTLEEIVEEILVRLPVKSIIRFESVCKGWLSKLRSRPLIEMHTRHQHSKIGSKKATLWNARGMPVTTIHLSDLYEIAPTLWADGEFARHYPLSAGLKLPVIGPLSNGVYCLTSIPPRGYDPGPDGHFLYSRIALWNPAIRLIRFLPPFPEQFRAQLDYFFSTLFRINLVSGFAAFPTASGALDYRVVVVIYDKKCLVAFVFSTLKGEWERLVRYEPETKEFVGPAQAFQGIGRIHTQCAEVCPLKLLRGCWHWITTSPGDRFKFNVLSYNFALQSFNAIGGPPKVHELGRFRSEFRLKVKVKADVLVLRDHLAVLFSYCTRKESFEFDVWMMMDYGVEESWTKIFNICPNYVSGYRLPYKLYWIEYKEEGSHAIRIKRLWFTTTEKLSTKKIKVICFDSHQGGVKATLYHHYDYLSLNTGGISTHLESLERL